MRGRTETAAKPPWRVTGATVRHAVGATTALGLEDDPDQWQAWTALDERQLIRLLTDSAPRDRPATNSTDTALPRAEHKDTP